MVVAVVLLVLTVREKKLAQEVAKANLEEETEEEQKAGQDRRAYSGSKAQSDDDPDLDLFVVYRI